MTLASMGSSVYLIFPLINHLSLSPIAGSKDANRTATIGKSDGENTAFDLSETEVAFFCFAVSEVFRHDTPGIGEGILC